MFNSVYKNSQVIWITVNLLALLLSFFTVDEIFIMQL